MHLQETPAERISIAPGRSQGENRLFEEQTAGKEFWRGLGRTFLGTLFVIPTFQAAFSHIIHEDPTLEKSSKC